MTRKTIICGLFSAVTFIGIMLFLWLGCPQYLLYQEQYQLFLYTWGYLTDSISQPGGLSNYISEFIVQFYYVPLYGSILTALVLTLTQIFLGASCRRSRFPEAAFAFATLPSVLYLGAMSDENLLLSYAVAMMFTTIFIYCSTLFRQQSVLMETVGAIIGFTSLYWIAGPIAFAFIVAVSILRHKFMILPLWIAIGFGVIYGIHALWFEQFPLSRMLLGINYYRIPEIYPATVFVMAASVSIMAGTTMIKPRHSGSRRKNDDKDHKEFLPPVIAAGAILLFAIIYVPASFNDKKSSILEYDALVRQGRWSEIISKAEKEKPSDNFSIQALNLALGMTGKLNETMFHYNQKGLESLIGKDRLDNTSQLISAEVLYRLGLTNIAFSTTFDLQESIMNDRKSGRMMKRMAECMIVNGNYKVASKYIAMLRKSHFYSDWARNAEKLLGNDKAVENHPTYGPLRRNGFSKIAFYNHSQLDRILAILANDSEGTNTLAWQYFCAATMLKGDLNALAGGYDYMYGRFGDKNIPRHVQEALAMFWTFSHNSFEGIPFPIGKDVMRQTAALAEAVTRNRNNQHVWSKAAPNSYGLYFLKNAISDESAGAKTDYQPTHE